MKKIKSKTLALVTAVALCAGAFVASVGTTKTEAKAESPQVDNYVVETVSNGDSGVEPFGLYTSIKVSVNGGGGEVWVTAKNSFTLFPSTVIVILDLYSSDTYQSDYTAMTLVASNYTDDLNMGKSIEARASTGGVQKYWKARVRYKADSNDWQEIITDTHLYNAQGLYVE